MSFKFLKLFIALSTKRLAAQSTTYALHNRQGKQAFVKENNNNNNSTNKNLCKRNINL